MFRRLMHQVFEGREWIKTGKASIFQRFKEIRYRMKDKSKPQTWTVDYYLKDSNKTDSLKIMFSGSTPRSSYCAKSKTTNLSKLFHE